LDNLRTALRWLIARGNADGAQRLAAATTILVWYGRGYPAEGRRWLEETLALDTAAGQQDESAAGAGDAVFGALSVTAGAGNEGHQLQVQAKVLLSIARLVVRQGDLSVAEKAASRSLALYRELGHPGEAAWPLLYLGRVALLRADFANARRFLEQTLAAYRESQTSGNVTTELVDLGAQTSLAQMAREEGNVEEAQVRANEVLKRARDTGYPSYICWASTILGELRYGEGRRDSARLVWEQGLRQAREAYDKHDNLIPALLDLGRLSSEQGDRGAAQSFLTEGLLLADELSRWQLAHALEAIVEVAVAEGDPESALQLAGAAAAVRNALGTPLWPTEHARLDPVVARARQSVTAATASAAWSRGSTMLRGQSVTLALDVLQRPSMPARNIEEADGRLVR
jgi:tetratricopeptide (TPR) repeat protein